MLNTKWWSFTTWNNENCVLNVSFKYLLMENFKTNWCRFFYSGNLLIITQQKIWQCVLTTAWQFHDKTNQYENIKWQNNIIRYFYMNSITYLNMLFSCQGFFYSPLYSQFAINSLSKKTKNRIFESVALNFLQNLNTEILNLQLLMQQELHI